jgi:hypothetical protein
LANVPGDQKLAPLSSADDDLRPKKIAKATKTIKFGKRFSDAAISPPLLRSEPNSILNTKKL